MGPIERTPEEERFVERMKLQNELLGKQDAYAEILKVAIVFEKEISKLKTKIKKLEAM